MSFWRPDDLLFINIIILNYCQLNFQESSCEQREYTTEVCPIYVTQSQWKWEIGYKSVIQRMENHTTKSQGSLSGRWEGIYTFSTCHSPFLFNTIWKNTTAFKATYFWKPLWESQQLTANEKWNPEGNTSLLLLSTATENAGMRWKAIKVWWF